MGSHHPDALDPQADAEQLAERALCAAAADVLAAPGALGPLAFPFAEAHAPQARPAAGPHGGRGGADLSGRQPLRAIALGSGGRAATRPAERRACDGHPAGPELSQGAPGRGAHGGGPARPHAARAPRRAAAARGDASQRARLRQPLPRQRRGQGSGVLPAVWPRRGQPHRRELRGSPLFPRPARRARRGGLGRLPRPGRHVAAHRGAGRAHPPRRPLWGLRRGGGRSGASGGRDQSPRTVHDDQPGGCERSLCRHLARAEPDAAAGADPLRLPRPYGHHPDRVRARPHPPEHRAGLRASLGQLRHPLGYRLAALGRDLGPGGPAAHAGKLSRHPGRDGARSPRGLRPERPAGPGPFPAALDPGARQSGVRPGGRARPERRGPAGGRGARGADGQPARDGGRRPDEGGGAGRAGPGAHRGAGGGQ
ncbi:hypothetical protein D3C86_1272260 [compost metagenome]